MAIKTVCQCDTCDAVIDITNGSHPAKINAAAPTPAEIGQQPEESHLCQGCWDKLCTVFPRFKQAERFAIPVPTPPSRAQYPAALDTATPEQLVALFAKVVGVEIAHLPDTAKLDSEKR